MMSRTKFCNSTILNLFDNPPFSSVDYLLESEIYYVTSILVCVEIFRVQMANKIV